MNKSEKITRIFHSVLCLLNIGSVFFCLMVLSGGGNQIYGFFRQLSIAFSVPMIIMRMAYLQYILFATIAVMTVIVYVGNIKNKKIDVKWLCFDIFLWLISFFELAYLEPYYLNIITF